jgi:hypothetical protein
MLPVLQVVTKTDLLPREASIFLEKKFGEYGIDHRTIIYADLRPLFETKHEFIIKKFELDKKFSKADLQEFKRLCGVKPPPPPPPKPKPLEPVVAPKPPQPKPVVTPKPVTKPVVAPKPKGTGKTK